MKYLLFSSLSLIILIAACKSSKQVVSPSASGLSTCEGLPNLQFQNQEDTINGQRLSKLAADLALAGKADAGVAATTPYSVSGNVNVKGSLAHTVNEKLVVSSKVSESFWEQNIVFTQVICFLERQSEKPTIPEAEKASIRASLREIVVARSKFATEFEKKSTSSRN